MNSSTSGLPSPAPRGSSSTGQRPGAIASVTSRNVVPADLVRGLAEDLPDRNDQRLLALLPLPAGCCLKPRIKDLGTAKTGWKGVLQGYELSGEADAAALIASDRLVSKALAPLPQPERAKLLMKLRHMTVSAVASQEDADLQMAAYADELGQYPADVVRHVLRTQPGLSKFWPAWAELHARLEPLARPRRLLCATIRDAIERQRAA